MGSEMCIRDRLLERSWALLAGPWGTKIDFPEVLVANIEFSKNTEKQRKTAIFEILASPGSLLGALGSLLVDLGSLLGTRLLASIFAPENTVHSSTGTENAVYSSSWLEKSKKALENNQKR